MNKELSTKSIYSMLFFILLFNFTDILTFLNTSNNIDLGVIIMSLLPTTYLIYEVKKNSEQLPNYIYLLALVSATLYISYGIMDVLISIVTFIFGEQELYVLYQYKIVIFLSFLLLAWLINNIKLGDKLIRKIIVILFSATIMSLLYLVVSTILGDNIILNLVNFDASYTNLISICFPFLYLCLHKFEKQALNEGLASSLIGYITIMIMVMLASNFVSYETNSVTLANTAFVAFINENTNQVQGSIMFLLYVLIALFKITVIYIIAVGSYESKNTHGKNHGFSITLIILTIEYMVVILFTDNLWTMKNLLQAYYMSFSIMFLVSLSIYGIYICFKQYIVPSSKALLLIVSSFPIIFCFFYLTYISSPLLPIINDTIHNLNIDFYIFSIIVMIFYTLESAELLFGYYKRKYTSSITFSDNMDQMHIFVLIPCMNEQVVINKTLNSLLNNQYQNLNIYVIDDASSDDTLLEIEKCSDERKHVLKRFKPNAQQGKGEALNWAYYQLLNIIDKQNLDYDDVLITIIDADTEVSSDYFHRVNKVFQFDPSITGLQSKVRVINLGKDSAQDLEFAQIINSMQSLRNLTNTVAFGGNGQFCRLSTLEKLAEKPWTKSLVEDFDLSTRLYLLLGEEIHNVQYDDIYIKQTGIVNDSPALVKQRVRWAQGNVQSFKYFKLIIMSKKLKKLQKLELCSTLIKPWLMAIEYVILTYTLVLIVDVLIFEGISRMLILVIVLFIAMGTYILFINLMWSILYNLEKEERFKVSNVISDTYYLSKFLFTLTQIYPQSILRHFKSDNCWEKIVRQAEGG